MIRGIVTLSLAACGGCIIGRHDEWWAIAIGMAMISLASILYNIPGDKND
jgi:hypothetical protein